MATKKSARQESMTLAEFDRAVNEHAGSNQAFAATVVALYNVRHEAALVAERRKECFERLKSCFARGERVAADHSGRLLRQTAPGEPKVVRSVPSAVIKKCSPTLWEQAKEPVPYVQCKPPAKWPVAAVEPLPEAPPENAPLAAALDAYEALAPRAKALREMEEELVDRLKKIGANNGWDGLPIEFADGWQVSLARMQYSSDKLARIAPETFAALAVETTQQRAPVVYVAKRGEGLAEDEEDDGE